MTPDEIKAKKFALKAKKENDATKKTKEALRKAKKEGRKLDPKALEDEKATAGRPDDAVIAGVEPSTTHATDSSRIQVNEMCIRDSIRSADRISFSSCITPLRAKTKAMIATKGKQAANWR